MYIMMVFFGKINLSSFSYMCLPGLENFPLLMLVTPLDICMTWVIRFALYCFGKVLYFLILSYLSFSRKINQLRVMVGKAKNSLFFLR